MHSSFKNWRNKKNNLSSSITVARVIGASEEVSVADDTSDAFDCSRSRDWLCLGVSNRTGVKE